MQYQHLDHHEEAHDLQSAFDQFDLADQKYSETPSSETFERRRSAMNLVSEMLLRGEIDDSQSPILSFLANIVERSASSNRSLS